MDSKGRMTAADISDAELIEAIRSDRRGWATLYTIEKALPHRPPKLLLAKLRSLSKRNKIYAECTCGCQGPFKLLQEKKEECTSK